jgi:general secretion pathway protein D
MIRLFFAVGLALAFVSASGQPPQDEQQRREAMLRELQQAQARSAAPVAVVAGPRHQPNTDLEQFALEVAERENFDVLIDASTPAQIYVGGTPIRNPDYADLLTILRLNGLAAVEIDGRINIFPLAESRWMATPLVQEDDDSIPDDAVITRVIDVPSGNAAQLIPILRPLLPQVAHFVASSSIGPPAPGQLPESGKIVIVDRYANVRRITAIIAELTE